MDTDFVDRWSVRLSGARSRRALSFVLTGMIAEALSHGSTLARNNGGVIRRVKDSGSSADESTRHKKLKDQRKRHRKSSGHNKKHQDRQQQTVPPPPTNDPPQCGTGNPGDTCRQDPGPLWRFDSNCQCRSVWPDRCENEVCRDCQRDPHDPFIVSDPPCMIEPASCSEEPRPQCAQVISFGREDATGECYSFPDSCIPDGWTADRTCEEVCYSVT